MQASARVDRGSLAGLVGVDELIGQPQFVAEFDPGWFLGQEGIRSRLRDKITDSMGNDLASPIGCGVDHRAADWDAGSSSLFVKGKGGRETGDPSTDDSDCAKIGHKVLQRDDSCVPSTDINVSASETE